MKIEIIKDEAKIKDIVIWHRRLEVKGFKILNTPWAKDKHGKRDTINLALFIEFENSKGEEKYYIISEAQLVETNKIFKKVKAYNLKHDSGGREFFHIK